MPSAIDDLVAAGRIDDALALCDDRLTTCPPDSLARADLLGRKARLLDWYRSDYAQCLVLLGEEEAIRRAHADAGLAGTCLQLGMILNFVGRHEEARRYLGLTLDRSESGTEIATAQNILGDMLLPDRPVEARPLLEGAAAGFAHHGSAYQQCHAAMSLAWLAACESNVDVALQCLQVELDRARALREPGIEGTGYLRLAQVLQMAGREQESRDCARRCHAIGAAAGWQVMMDEANALWPAGRC